MDSLRKGGLLHDINENAMEAQCATLTAVKKYNKKSQTARLQIELNLAEKPDKLNKSLLLPDKSSTAVWKILLRLIRRRSYQESLFYRISYPQYAS